MVVMGDVFTLLLINFLWPTGGLKFGRSGPGHGASFTAYGG